MTAYVRCKSTFPHVSGLPSLAVVNSWAFITIDPTTREGAADAFTILLNNFYTSIKSYLSSQYAWNDGTHSYVDMGDAKPRVPYQVDAAALGTLSTTNLDQAPETAITLSFRGSTGSGLNAKRRRGRVYIGPLQVPTGDMYGPTNTIVDAIANAGSSLMSSSALNWAIYSPSTHHDVPVGGKLEDYPDEVPSLLDDSFVEVVAVWVDNAYDTQRRRGLPASYRKTV